MHLLVDGKTSIDFLGSGEILRKVLRKEFNLLTKYRSFTAIENTYNSDILNDKKIG